MRRLAVLSTIFTTVLVLVLPFIGGGGHGLSAPSYASEPANPRVAATVIAPVQSARTTPLAGVAWTPRINEAALAAHSASLKIDFEHLAQKPVPKPLPPVSVASAASGTTERRAARVAVGQSCPGDAGGGIGGAPGTVSAGGVAGTTSDDLASFARKYNAIRVANCLQPIPYGNFRYDSCMEARLFWMAEDPSTDPLSAWGHMGSQRSDGVPSVGCDGNLAGGSGNSGATMAQKWWDSTSHRNSLYRPTFAGGTGGVCIAFAMTHGGLPNEAYSFARAAARWIGC